MVLSLAFISKVLFVNLTYTKLQWKQEEAQAQQDPSLQSSRTSMMNATTTTTTSLQKTDNSQHDRVAIPIPRKVQIERQQRLEKHRERMNTTTKEKLLRVLRRKPKRNKSRLERLNEKTRQFMMRKRQRGQHPGEQQQGGEGTATSGIDMWTILDTQQKQHTHTTRYAYAFLIGGVHEDRPAYKGFLYNVLIASYLLHISGSTMDIIVYIQMSPDSKLPINKLPIEDQRLIDEFNKYIISSSQSSLQQQTQNTTDRLKIKFVDRQSIIGNEKNKETFSELVFDKFRILQEIQYDRVMFLDGDVIPLTNLDYFFYLSEEPTADNEEDGSISPILQPNFIMASRGEPCNAGMFILQPKIGEWDQLQAVIHEQHVTAKDLPYPKFDREYGTFSCFVLYVFLFVFFFFVMFMCEYVVVVLLCVCCHLV